MAKDARGHGSDTGTRGMRLVKTHVLGPHSAKVYKNPEWQENVVKFFHNGVYQSKADSHTPDMADAHATAQHQLQRYADQDAAKALSSGGPKSVAAPVHSSMAAYGQGDARYAELGGSKDSHKGVSSGGTFPDTPVDTFKAPGTSKLWAQRQGRKS